MTEQEFKKMFERYAEPIVLEILKPLEDKINNNLQRMLGQINLFEHKLGLVYKRQLKIRRELTIFKEFIECSMQKLQETVEKQQTENADLEGQIYSDVKGLIDKAIYYGEKAEELFLTNQPDFTSLVAKAKAAIKDESDLRIMEVLKLEKRVRDLMGKDTESPIIIK